jgi:aminoglycoside phosphotransferase family enzyme/predicted kinase
MDRAGIEQLCRPAAFDHPADDLVLRETHISWVILCGEYAYKIKKPVNFGFLDFSTLERRKHFCEEELRLNRRFSPELYLDVVAVTEGAGGLVFGGEGAPVDYAVRMRRFDESQLLDTIAAREGLDAELLRAIARELARLHTELPRCFPDPEGSDAGTPAALHAALTENFRQLGEYPLGSEQRRQLRLVEDWSEARYRELLPTMQQRVRDGWVIDGHGDDHLGNMAIIDGKVRLFDCIEFNADFRVVDSIAEIALLDMDLCARGHPAESYRLLTDYLEYRGDYAGLQLLDLYRVYFALVRAKVNLLRHAPDATDLVDLDGYRESQRYLAMAHQYCQPRPRFLAITHGLSGSGKSTVAGKLVEATGAVRIRSDVERKRLFGLAPEQRSRPEDVPTLYATDMSRKTFQRLQLLSAQVIGAGFPVIVDGTFLHQRVRDDFRRLAGQLEVPFIILECVADLQELRRRLLTREAGGLDASEADIAVMEQQRKKMEPLSEAEREAALVVDSGVDADALGEAVSRKLAQVT